MIHETAFVGKNVEIGENTTISAFAHIEDNVKIGKNVFIGEHASIGRDSIIEDDVYIGIATCIGSEGYSYNMDPKYQHHHFPQMGIAHIGKNVKIGNHCFVDRAAFLATKIGDNCRIGDMSHIAHNITIGENTDIHFDIVIAGSSHIGKNCKFGGMVSVNGHVQIGDNIEFGDRSGCNGSVFQAGKYIHYPEMPEGEYQEFLEAREEIADLIEEWEKK